MKKYQKLAILAMLAAFTVGQTPQPDILILFPQQNKSLVLTGVASITGRFEPTTVASVQLLENFSTQHDIKIPKKKRKEQFSDAMREIFSDNIVLERVSLKISRTEGETLSSEYRFQLENNVDRNGFWLSPAFNEILELIDDKKVLNAAVTLEGWSIRNAPVSSAEYQKQFGETFSFSVALVPGINLFYVRAVAEDTTITASGAVRFFYKTDIQDIDPPADFVRQTFHTDTNEQQCLSCHTFTLPASAGAQTAITVETECKPCHNALVSQKSAHGPAASWNCTICHDPDASPRYQLYTDRAYDASLCFTCHTDTARELDAKPVLHGPVTNNDCRKCHDPHGSRHDALVIERVNKLCTSCHAGTELHPIVGHPLEGVRNPLNPEKAFSCIACHYPHGSDHQYLLVASIIPNKLQFCQQCHHK